MVATHKGKQYKKATGLTTTAPLWDKKAKSLQAKCKDKRIWDKLRAIDIRATGKEDEADTEEDVLRVMEYAITEKMPPKKVSSSHTRKIPTFWEYFNEWADRECTQKRQKRLCYNNIARLMGKDFDWADIDTAFHFRLVQKMQAEDFGINYQWKTVSQLKTVMSEGLKLKYHTNTDFQMFKTRREEPDTVYLTSEEVERLWEYKPKGELERKARDLFLLGVWSCARFSDYSRLSMEMIWDGAIHFTQKKTASSVIVPASPRLIEILERNGGRAPHLAQQHLNEWIKKVCRACDITQKVEVTRGNGLIHTTETKEKCDLVSSHSARRTGATLLYLTGIPLQQVMLITGHKDHDSIRHYLRLSKEENVEKLKDNPFFK